jgi:predicted nucleic acid-binding Zn ribbon protein
MPTYVYKFINSGETFEVAQAFTDPSLTEAVHPVTGQLQPVKKVFTPVGVTFRGDGFYKTDNRNGSKRSGASAGESPSSTPASDSSSSGAKEPTSSAPASTPKSSESSGSKSPASSSSSSSSD